MGTNPSSATDSVLDASVVVRALVGREREAQARLRRRAAWPTHLYAEVAHALLRYHRQRVLSLERAQVALAGLHTADVEAYPVESLTRSAWGVALDLGLTVYDACYVVLAEGLDVPLVTADRRLAEATPNGVLLS